MKQTKGLNSRRAFIKISALGLGALGAGASPSVSATAEEVDPVSIVPDADTKQPVSELAVWFTNDKERFAAGRPIQWQAALTAPAADSIQLVVANKFQDILGFGGCFSDASCYLIHQLHTSVREQLLHDLFHPSEMGLNVNRTCIGACDSAAKVYSYDEGDEDPDLKRFSIDHDREYILPVLRRVREINPDVFYFSSPWSPPGWMKWNKSMLGGSMSRQYLAAYAQYFLKFLQAYAAEGVSVQAITTQNEIDTDQHGQMPACTWSQECETEFVIEHLGPLFERQIRPPRYGSWIITMCIGGG
jgi:glucosylceramidase